MNTTTETSTRRTGLLAATVRDYVLPFGACASVAGLWLIVISTITAATGSTLLVLALVVLPGAVIMGVSARERGRWFEYVLVWIGFFTAVPLYGVVLLIGGYGIVLARAWRRRRPRITEDPEG
ncbi:hypothetical protein [Brachybacterium atlanticum]|uniref:hypothetical protein n=1 Tax=Brachybacterium atlanticum TaxID=2911888 RepID=UPI0021DFDC50|nr:hypothetical protein [Brachybacterium atlanticum]